MRAWPHNPSSWEEAGSCAQRRRPATEMICEKLRLPGDGWVGRSFRTPKGFSGLCDGSGVVGMPWGTSHRVRSSQLSAETGWGGYRSAVSSPRNRRLRCRRIAIDCHGPRVGLLEAMTPTESVGTQSIWVHTELLGRHRISKLPEFRRVPF